jgi:predicted O-linked N-acetylglucosamine transferase (SPINDLY family)
MSVPLLTKFEKSFLSRCGKSINSNLGLNDWICTTDDEYVSKAIKFGNDINYLKKTKEFLITNKSKKKLFNIDSFAKNLSFTLKKIWHDYNSSL